MHPSRRLDLLHYIFDARPSLDELFVQKFLFISAPSSGLLSRPSWPPNIRSLHPFRVSPADSHGSSILGAQSFASAICTHIGAILDLTKTHTTTCDQFAL